VQPAHGPRAPVRPLNAAPLAARRASAAKGRPASKLWGEPVFTGCPLCWQPLCAGSSLRNAATAPKTLRLIFLMPAVRSLGLWSHKLIGRTSGLGVYCCGGQPEGSLMPRICRAAHANFSSCAGEVADSCAWPAQGKSNGGLLMGVEANQVRRARASPAWIN